MKSVVMREDSNLRTQKEEVNDKRAVLNSHNAEL
jgi:hypothetical protein